jgi:voltage-gated potassium channel
VNLEELTRSNKFELLVGILTLLSVGLALILYIPDVGPESQTAIYVFDLFVVVILVFDFCARTKLSGEGSRYILRHWYEIPAMLPLLMFTSFENPFAIGAAVRSLRLIRLVRLLRLFRLVNLFRAADHWKLSTLLYMSLILTAAVIFGAIAIFEVEQETPIEKRTINSLEDGLWFAFTTITISGFGDVYPFSTIGRIIAAILSFIGLAIILGFISNIGTSFVVSKLNKSHKKQLEETKELVKNKINTLEQLHVDDNMDLVNKLNNMQEQLIPQNSLSNVCHNCNISIPPESIYCNKCGSKLI